MKNSLKTLQETLAYSFQRDELLVESLTHPSFAAEKKSIIIDNQRLEFLGDAVIEIIVTSRIYHQFPELQEGELTKIRSALTREATLAELARSIELGSHLFLGKGEKLNKGFERNSTLCDAFEALVGAIYLDSAGDLEACATVVNTLLDQVYTEIDVRNLIDFENPKGKLQEWSQKNHGAIPVYRLLGTSGPDHERIFSVAVHINKKCFGKGEAGKRQTAEECAARKALEQIRSTSNR